MAQFEDSYSGTVKSETNQMNEWAAGFIFLGSMMMVILGCWHFIAGISALFDDSFYAIRPGFALEIDVTAWGWLHVIGGIVLAVVGFLLLSGSAFIRLIAIGLTVISVIWNFYSIPYYPVWSIIMLALCGAVLWALIAHGKEFTKAMNE
jgi:hypothetical protein